MPEVGRRFLGVDVPPKRLSELQTDVAAADHDGTRGTPLEMSDAVVHVRDLRSTSTRGSSAPGIGGRTGGAGAQHELVVGLSVGPSLLIVADLYFLGVSGDADHILTGANVEGEALGETFGGLQKQTVPLRDGPADVYGRPQFANET